MKKVAINRTWGGFGLSIRATMLYLRKKYPQSEVHYEIKEEIPHLPTTIFYVDGKETYPWFDDREEKALIETIEELGSEKASGRCAKLKVVEIPDDVQYEISDYDGVETIEEVHRSWC